MKTLLNEISRKASVIEIIFNIYSKLWKFSGQFFCRTPSSKCFCLNYFSMKHDELWWSLAFITKWLWMFDSKTVVDTDLYLITPGWMWKCLSYECFCIVKTISNTKLHKLEYFCSPPEAVADRGYSNISGGVQKYWLLDVMYFKTLFFKIQYFCVFSEMFG